jgi:hypothetical protein
MNKEKILNTRCHRKEHMTRKTKGNMAAGTIRNQAFMYWLQETGTTYICAYNWCSKEVNRVTLSILLT